MLSRIGLALYLCPLTRPVMRRWVRNNIAVETIHLVERYPSGRWAAASGRLYRIDGAAHVGANRVRRLSSRRFLAERAAGVRS